MTSQNETGAVLVLDPLPSLLDQLATLAATVLGEHRNDAGLCASCGSAWPCGLVVLAEHNLAVL
jgi:hypothetical protein